MEYWYYKSTNITHETTVSEKANWQYVVTGNNKKLFFIPFKLLIMSMINQVKNYIFSVCFLLVKISRLAFNPFDKMQR